MSQSRAALFRFIGAGHFEAMMADTPGIKIGACMG
jgi:hypothetical protein